MWDAVIVKVWGLGRQLCSILLYLMTKSLRKKTKQGLAQKTEVDFEGFCRRNGICYEKIDEPKNMVSKKKFLRDVEGKCPDFWCKKNGKEIFVEVKTLTNLTNQKREESMEKLIEENRSKSLPCVEVFDPTPEIRGPFKGFLKKASKKFKNLRCDLVQPRILFIDGMFEIDRFTINTLFLGAYDTYNTKLTYTGLRKKEKGLFDETGSNVSAVMYWNEQVGYFQYAINPKAKISFTEDFFSAIFQKKLETGHRK